MDFPMRFVTNCASWTITANVDPRSNAISGPRTAPDDERRHDHDHVD